MELSAPFVWFNGSTLSASVNFEHVRIGVIAVCFMLFPLSEGLAQSPSATSLCNMPSARGSAMYNQYCGGGYAAPRPYYAAPQPYVPPPPSPAEIAAQREHQLQARAVELNNKAVEAEKSDNWDLAVSLYEEAARMYPSDPTIAENSRKRARNLIIGGRNKSPLAIFNKPSKT